MLGRPSHTAHATSLQVSYDMPTKSFAGRGTPLPYSPVSQEWHPRLAIRKNAGGAGGKSKYRAGKGFEVQAARRGRRRVKLWSWP